MTTAISIEDVRREVKILKALSGHQNLVKFYDACEDGLNVYIVMEYVLFLFNSNFNSRVLLTEIYVLIVVTGYVMVESFLTEFWPGIAL